MTEPEREAAGVKNKVYRIKSIVKPDNDTQTLQKKQYTLETLQGQVLSTQRRGNDADGRERRAAKFFASELLVVDSKAVELPQSLAKKLNVGVGMEKERYAAVTAPAPPARRGRRQATPEPEPDDEPPPMNFDDDDDDNDPQLPNYQIPETGLSREFGMLLHLHLHPRLWWWYSSWGGLLVIQVSHYHPPLWYSSWGGLVFFSVVVIQVYPQKLALGRHRPLFSVSATWSFRER